jgi:hypothetical protein
MATATGLRVRMAIMVTANAARAAEIVLKSPVSYADVPVYHSIIAERHRAAAAPKPHPPSLQGH